MSCRRTLLSRCPGKCRFCLNGWSSSDLRDSDVDVVLSVAVDPLVPLITTVPVSGRRDALAFRRQERLPALGHRILLRDRQWPSRIGLLAGSDCGCTTTSTAGPASIPDRTAATRTWLRLGPSGVLQVRWALRARIEGRRGRPTALPARRTCGAGSLSAGWHRDSTRERPIRPLWSGRHTRAAVIRPLCCVIDSCL
jgi:hypothetical protein